MNDGETDNDVASLMPQTLVDGKYDEQSETENEITDRANDAHVGTLGFCKDTTVLATFMKVGPQRADGVRIVCMQPCCCFEPRIAATEFI